MCIRDRRDEDPPWWDTAIEDNARRDETHYNPMLPRTYPEVHASESSWAGCTEDYVIVNDGTLEDLQEAVKSPELSRLVSILFLRYTTFYGN